MIRPDDVRPYEEDDREKLRRRVYVSSPDKKKCLDPFVGMDLYRNNGRIRAAFDIDSGVALIDLRSKEYKRLLYCGTPCGWDEARWLDNHSFVVAGSEEDASYKNVPGTRFNPGHLPTLHLFDLSKNEVTWYKGSPVTGATFGKIKKLLWRNRRRRFPNIDFG